MKNYKIKPTKEFEYMDRQSVYSNLQNWIYLIEQAYRPPNYLYLDKVHRKGNKIVYRKLLKIAEKYKK